jgi:hypothetical protein
MIDNERARALRTSLAADGYDLEIAEDSGRFGVTISATPEACADCLVPKDLMRGILGQALGVAPESIDLTYPSGRSGNSREPGEASEAGEREADAST